VRIHQDNGDSRLLVTITTGTALGIEQGRWSLDIRSPVVQSPAGLVHAWLERTADDVRFVIADPGMTVTIPGTADAVITVASVDASKPFKVAPYSCFGPTRDGREKPDVAAPGQQVTAAMAGTNTGVLEQSGTSMAAPHVTGAIALLLSRRAKLADSTPGLKQLNANQIAAILRVTTQEHSGSWNKGIGYGVLDLAAALHGIPVD
jgi:subtilisin family serine protease